MHTVYSMKKSDGLWRVTARRPDGTKVVCICALLGVALAEARRAEPA